MYTEFFQAISSEDIEWIKRNLVLLPANAYNDDGRTALSMAVFGSNRFLRELLELGFDPNLQDQADGMTPLFFAVVEKKIEAVKTLLNFNASIGLEGLDDTVLHYASREGWEELVELLLKKCVGDDLNRFDYIGMTPLMCAVSFGHGSIARRLVLAGSDVNASDGRKTALHIAAQSKNVEMYNYLVQCGGDVMQTDITGATASFRQKNGPFFEK